MFVPRKIFSTFWARAVWLAAACLLSLVCVAAAAARGWLPFRTYPRAPEAASPPAAVPQAGQVEVEQLALTPAGFEPSELTRPGGPFRLVVENRSGVDEVELSLESEGGGRANALRSRRRRLSWAEGMNLPAGRYALSVRGRPEWQCVINIIPN
jgi:hypothetical protein